MDTSESGEGSGEIERLRTLREIGRVVGSTLDLSVLYETIYREVGRLMDTSQFFIALHHPERSTIEIPYHREAGRLLVGDEIPDSLSVTASVIREKTAFFFRTPEEWDDYVRRNGLKERIVGESTSDSGIFVPLTAVSRTIGALTVQSTRARAYAEADVETLTLIGAQAAVAIENARLYSQLRRRVDELQTIQSIVEKLTPLVEIPEIAAVINEELRRLISYHSCRVFLLDGDTLTPVAYEGSDLSGIPLKIGEGLVGWIAETGEAVIVGDTLLDPRVIQLPNSPLRNESMIGAPLVYEGQVRGVVTLSEGGTHRFDENSLRLLQIIAGQLAIVVDRARLYEELRLQAITDPVVAIHNRRYLESRLGEERARARRMDHPIAAMMLDVDRFKTINDTYGHDAGDVVLRDLAHLIRSAVRADDVAARYGGEEFCVILPGVDMPVALRVAERLRASIEQYRLSLDPAGSGITASVGVAVEMPNRRKDDLIKRADKAMFEAKRRGGNCVFAA